MQSSLHPNKKFSYIPAINAYSSGVTPAAGYSLVGLRFDKPTTFLKAIEYLDKYLPTVGLDPTNIVSFEFRSPKPFSFNGFGDFNEVYYNELKRRNLLIDSINPIARTNVSPVYMQITEPLLFGLHVLKESNTPNKDYVVAGSGEVDGALDPNNIIARGDLTPSGLEKKARFVLEEMRNRLLALRNEYVMPTEVNVYTVHEIAGLPALIDEYLPGLAKSCINIWVSAPPIIEVEFEMDLRRLSTQLLIN